MAKISNDQFQSPTAYLEYLNTLMIQKNASDMYLTYGEPPVLRILEEVHRETDLEPLDDELLNQLALTLMNTTGLDFFEKHGSIDLGIGYQDRRYRVNISRQRGHIMIVARLLRKKVPTLESLCLPGIFKELSHRTNGIIFLAGRGNQPNREKTYSDNWRPNWIYFWGKRKCCWSERIRERC